MAQSVKFLMWKSEDLSSAPRAQMKTLGGVLCTYNPSTEPTTKISGLASQPVYSPSCIYNFFHFYCINLVRVCMCVSLCVQVHVCRGMHVAVAVRRQFEAVGSLFLPCGLQRSNSGSLAW